MTDVDVSKINPGDVVGVRVFRLCDEETVAADAGWAMPTIIKRSAIVSHTPAPRPALKVGDRVVSPSTGGEWEIVFIQNTGPGYAHFAHQPDAALWPHPLSEVETWERV